MAQENVSAVGQVKSIPSDPIPGVEYVATGDLCSFESWPDLVRSVNSVIHLAGRAHKLAETSGDPLTEFRAVHVDVTEALAQAAGKADVENFVFVSSIHVNGPSSDIGGFNETSPPAPFNPYSISKHQAEQRLIEIASPTSMNFSIVRPPLVYGKGARGNVAALVKYLRKTGITPFGSIRNQRSLIDVRNLVDFLFLCTRHETAANELFLIADNERLTIVEIMDSIAKGMRRRTRHFKVPTGMLSLGARLVGQSHRFRQLTDNLVVNNTKARQLLGWQPTINTIEGLQEIID